MYDMTIVLLKWNGQCSWSKLSEQFWMLFMYYVLICEVADAEKHCERHVCVCVLCVW